MTDEQLLILIGVASRYLVGEGLVQEAVFMNKATGEEYVLGLVEGQYESLLEILRLNNGESESRKADEVVEPREPASRKERPNNRSNSKVGSWDVSGHTDDEEEEEAEEEDSYEEDVVDDAQEDAVRAVFGRGF